MENRIRSIRQSKKMKGTEVAESLGITPQFYYDIELGKRNLEILRGIQLAKILGVSVEYMMGEDNPTESETLLSPLCCTKCDKELVSDMDIEYSQELTSYFCTQDCARDYYFEEMGSILFDPLEEELEERGLYMEKGKLYKLE